MTLQVRTIQDALGDRFSIVREIGSGGMAVVYLARDARQDRDVAIKVLRPELIDSSSAERFLREIRLEGRVHHPNILPIYDSATAGPFLYYVMPFVTGETLSSRLAREGPLPVNDAIRIAREVAEALACAHSEGVIHRDVKPQNILLSGGHAVLADFGVAAAVAASTSANLTSSGIVLGTPTYMSPEQASAAGAVDKRSDIYSLGCVLYEMLAGEPPFTGRTAASIFAKHYAEPVPSLDVIRPDVPPRLVQIVTKMLAKVAADRYEDAQVLIKTLDRAVLGHRRSVIEFIRDNRRKAAMMSGAIAVVTLSIFTPPARHLGSWLGTPGAKYVAILPFENTDSSDAVLAAGLTRSFTDLVSKLAAENDTLWVVPSHDMRAAGVRSPAEVRRIYPVDLVVAGKVQRNGKDVSLSLELFDVRRDRSRIVKSTVVREPSESLSQEAAQDLLGRSLHFASYKSSADPTKQEVSPAHRFYVQGIGSLERDYNEANLETAIKLFRNGLLADSSYPPAYAGLCQAFWSLYIRTGETANADEARRMCDRAVRLSDSDPSALTSLGASEFFTGQFERAEQTLRTAIARRGGADAHRWLGHVLQRLGKFDEAEHEFKRAIDLRNDVWIYFADLGDLYIYAGRYEEAIAVQRDVIDLSPDNYRGYNELAVALMFLNRMEEADSVFRRATEVQPNAYLTYRNFGLMHLKAHRYEDALVVLARGISLNPNDWVAWRWQAHAQHWLGRTTQERASWYRVVELLERGLKLNPKNQDMLCGLAEALVALGETERGLQHLNYLASLVPAQNMTFWMAGRVYEMVGSRAAALNYINKALALGFDPTMIARDPWLAKLRSDPQYRGPR